MSWVWVLRACLLRDYRTDRSYLAAFALGVLGSLVSLALFFYLAGLVDPGDVDDPAAEAAGFFTFLVIGIAVYDILNALLVSIPARVRQDQLTGALEALLTTRAHPFAIALGYGLYDLVRKLLETVVLVVVAVAVFDADFVVTWEGLTVAVAALVLVVVLFAAMGVAAAGFVIAYKRVQAVIGLVATVIALVGTVYYPANVLPRGLEVVAELNPLTWGLDVIRAALTGTDVEAWQLVLLGVVAALSIPAAAGVIHLAIRRAKRQGTLGAY
jgi:ABC-2 type transport system permease protein